MVQSVIVIRMVFLLSSADCTVKSQKQKIECRGVADYPALIQLHKCLINCNVSLGYGH